MARPKVTIGWAEHVDLVEWGISGLPAKIDTGARTSALHVENLVQVSDTEVDFDVIVHRDRADIYVPVRATVLKWARVRSSTGVYKKRCFVRTRMKLGPVEKEIELSLVSREKMVYRMLVGRTALSRDFLVDVSKRHRLAPKGKKPRIRITKDASNENRNP